MRYTQTLFTISGCLFICALVGVPLYVSSAKITGTFDFAEGTGVAEVFLAPTIVVSKKGDVHGVERILKPDWKGESGKPIVTSKVQPSELTKNGKIGSGIKGTYTLNIDDQYLVEDNEKKEKTTYIWGIRLNAVNNIYELQRQTVLKGRGQILQSLYQNINPNETKEINIKISHLAEEPAHQRKLAQGITARRLQDQVLESPSVIKAKKEKKDEIHVIMTSPRKKPETAKPQGSAPAPPVNEAASAPPAPTGASESDNAAEATKTDEPAPGAAAPKAVTRKAKPMGPGLKAIIGDKFEGSTNSAAAPAKAPQVTGGSPSLAERKKLLASRAANSAAASGEDSLAPIPTKSVGIPLVIPGMTQEQLLERITGIKAAVKHEAVPTTGLMGKAN